MQLGLKQRQFLDGLLMEIRLLQMKKTIGHAWTLAVIKDKNGKDKFMGLDATWDLFEGVPTGHILKSFNKDIVSYSSTGGSKLTFSKTHLIQLN